MPKDRRDDRHAAKGRLIRPVPEELWERLGEKTKNRNKVISELIAMYIDGRIVLDSERGDDEGAPPAKP